MTEARFPSICLGMAERSNNMEHKLYKSAEEKKLAIETVQKMFRINVSEDVAEAILIGKYATRQHKSTKAF